MAARTQQQLGILIREWRKQNRLSQSELAEQLGISQGYVSQMELGEAFSTLPLLCELADLMHVSLDELVGRKPNATSTEYTADHQTLHRLMESILEASPDERSRLLKFIELYASR